MLAPFLHAASSERHIPLGYGSDFAEFLRAYRTRFAHDLIIVPQISSSITASLQN